MADQRGEASGPHPLLEVLEAAAQGNPPPVDGGVTFFPELTGGNRAIVALTGHACLCTDQGPDAFADLELDGFGAALDPLAVLRLADGGRIGVNDAILVIEGNRWWGRSPVDRRLGRPSPGGSRPGHAERGPGLRRCQRVRHHRQGTGRSERVEHRGGRPWSRARPRPSVPGAGQGGGSSPAAGSSPRSHLATPGVSARSSPPASPRSAARSSSTARVRSSATG